jgi:CBS domain-containing protein
VSFQLSLSTESVMAAYPDDPMIVAPNATVGEVLQLMKAQRIGSVLICEGGKLQGIFTDRDALYWMAKNSSETETLISDLMTREPTCLEADTSVGESIQLMSAGRYRHLPIVDKQHSVTGMATVYGIVHYLVDHFPQTIYTLPPEPGQVTSEREGA